jgi:hypothetical protein
MSVESDFIFIVNEDQDDLYPEIEGVTKMVAPSQLWSIGKANFHLDKFVDCYSTITFIDDDTVVATLGWDAILARPIKYRGFGVSYGNDTIQGQNLPTKWMISANIVKALGFMAPPALTHLWADNYIKSLGENLAALDYFPDVIMEHHHYLNGLAEKDEIYASIYDGDLMKKDREVLYQHYAQDFAGDLDRVRTMLQLTD